MDIHRKGYHIVNIIYKVTRFASILIGVCASRVIHITSLRGTNREFLSNIIGLENITRASYTTAKWSHYTFLK